MKRLLTFLVLFALAGCQSPDRQLMEALNKSWLLLEPYTLAGIAVDATIDADERAIRNRQVDEFRLTLQAGLKASGGGLSVPDELPSSTPTTPITSFTSPPSAGASRPSSTLSSAPVVLASGGGT